MQRERTTTPTAIQRRCDRLMAAVRAGPHGRALGERPLKPGPGLVVLRLGRFWRSRIQARENGSGRPKPTASRACSTHVKRASQRYRESQVMQPSHTPHNPGHRDGAVD